MLCVELSAGDGDEVPLFTVDHQEMRRQPEAESTGQPEHPNQKVRYLLYTTTSTLIRKYVTSYIHPPQYPTHSSESTLPLIYSRLNTLIRKYVTDTYYIRQSLNSSRSWGYSNLNQCNQSQLKVVEMLDIALMPLCTPTCEPHSATKLINMHETHEVATTRWPATGYRPSGHLPLAFKMAHPL